MDGVELARRAAAVLHEQAVAAGRDPWTPLAFVLAEVARVGLDAEEVPVGSTMLSGGRACLVPKAEIIFYERVDSDFERAFLIAHELGHLHVEGPSDAATEQAPLHIDPARAAEAAPVGMERVVDYGRRQRREIQMDLFAREFLLPRNVVRRLHVDGGMTASEIATKLGAPYEVVVQQFLDALLLPKISDLELTPKPASALNDLQHEAAQHDGDAFLLEAGPGTGKTKTLVARIGHLLERDVDPRRILVLTFSNKAAAEIAERIAAHNPSAAAVMWTGTFHAFGLDLIRRFHTELAISPDVRLLDRTEAVELLEHEFPRLNLSHYRDIYDPTDILSAMLSAISRAKDEVVFADGYRKLADAMKAAAGSEREAITAEKAVEVAQVYALYEKLKSRANAVDFGDLVSLPVKLMEENPGVKAALRDTYDHVLVDEYQDVNQASVRLLKNLCGVGQGLWAVGDAKQSIYRFRGASSYSMERFEDDFPGARRKRLADNYRSVSEITDAFTQFATQMVVSGEETGTRATRGASKHGPELRRVAAKELQAVAIADAIEEMREAGHAFRDQVVLCTGNAKLGEFGSVLEQLGIPVLFLGVLFERQEVRDLLSILTLMVDRRATGLLRTACLPGFEMPLDDVRAVMAYLRDADAPGHWRPTVVNIPGLSSNGQDALERLDVALSDFGPDAQPWKVLATVLFDTTDMARRIASSGSVSDQACGIAVWQLMNFIRAQPAGKGLPIQRLTDRIRRLVRLSDERDLRQLPAAASAIDAVRLMTIHGAKGLEFEVVHLPGMNADTLPRTVRCGECPPPSGLIPETAASLDGYHDAEVFKEFECLFFVALSRAKDRLLLYAVDFKGKQVRKLSPFVERLGDHLTISQVHPKRTPPLAPTSLPVELVVRGELVLPSHALTTYDNCGRRFLYAYLLRAGGGATRTGFQLMHAAVREVVSDVRLGTVATSADVSDGLQRAFEASGLVEHGYSSDYLSLAERMIQYFTESRAGRSAVSLLALVVELANGHLEVLPDDVLRDARDALVLRRVDTRKARSSPGDDLAVVSLLLAAQQVSPSCRVEVVSLSDATTAPVELKATLLSNRREKVERILQAIRAGDFKTDPSPYVCPKCPAYFVCGALPAGPLVTDEKALTA